MAESLQLVRTYILLDCPHCGGKIKIRYRLEPTILEIKAEKKGR